MAVFFTVLATLLFSLFKAEFTRMSEQNSTEDKMFRIDLLCGLKGSSEFWKILIQHYNGKVFHFTEIYVLFMNKFIQYK